MPKKKLKIHKDIDKIKEEQSTYHIFNFQIY